jgi:hypothetical protein
MNYLLVNGDSYSESCEFPVYADYLSDHWNIPLVNLAIAGSNNDRICRSTVEHIEKQDLSVSKPFVIIGWSFIRRLEVWYYGENKKILKRIPDKEDSSVYNRFVTLDFLLPDDATLEQKCLLQEDLFVHKQLMEFYTKIFFLATYLESKNIGYLFFSGAKNSEVPMNCFPSLEKMSLIQNVMQNNKIYNLHDFYIMDYAFKNDPDCEPDTGHLSKSGHKKFAQYILENML